MIHWQFVYCALYVVVASCCTNVIHEVILHDTSHTKWKCPLSGIVMLVWCDDPLHLAYLYRQIGLLVNVAIIQKWLDLCVLSRL